MYIVHVEIASNATYERMRKLAVKQQHLIREVMSTLSVGGGVGPMMKTQVRSAVSVRTVPYDAKDLCDMLEFEEDVPASVLRSTRVWTHLAAEVDLMTECYTTRFLYPLVMLEAVSEEEMTKASAGLDGGKSTGGAGDGKAGDAVKKGASVKDTASVLEAAARLVVDLVGENELRVCRMLPRLAEFAEFLERARTVANALCQLYTVIFADEIARRKAKLKDRVPPLAEVKDVRRLFEPLAKLLGMFVVIDQVMRIHMESESGVVLHQAWQRFMTMLGTVALEPERYETNVMEICNIQRYAERLGTDVLAGHTLDMCINTLSFPCPSATAATELQLRLFDSITKMAADQDAVFQVHVEDGILCAPAAGLASGLGGGSLSGSSSSLKIAGAVLSKRAVTESIRAKEGSGVLGERFLGTLALFVLACDKFYPGGEIIKVKKLFRVLWTMCGTSPLCAAPGGILIFPHALMKEYYETSLAKLVKKGADALMVRELGVRFKALVSGSSDLIQGLQVATSAWVCDLESFFPLSSSKGLESRALEAAFVERAVSLLFTGIALGHRAQALLMEIFHLHATVGAELGNNAIAACCSLIVILKVIDASFFRRALIVSELTRCVLGASVAAVQDLLEVPHLRLRGAAQKNADAYGVPHGAVVAITEMLKNGVTHIKVRALSWLLHVSMLNGGNSNMVQVVDRLHLELDFMEVCSRLDSVILASTDCSMLYWMMSLFPALLIHINRVPKAAFMLESVMRGLDDVCPMLAASSLHTKDPNELRDEFVANTKHTLETDLLHKVAVTVEDSLRRFVSAHLDVSGVHYLKSGIRDVGRMASEDVRLYFGGTCLRVRDYVANHLGETFYNLTVLSPHASSLYMEMRCIALERYGVNLVDPHLPFQSAGVGLDVLEIMRHIHVFVSRYAYNLNQQFFVEYQSDSKMLMSLSINEVADSIRTHGTGIMNTAVNVVFQFITKKLAVVSKFLFDDHIKSLLLKEVRYFRDHCEDVDYKYSFNRAETLRRRIRKLSERDGPSFLSLFRKLITEIGNALGYVRLVRSGGLRVVSTAVQFIPENVEQNRGGGAPPGGSTRAGEDTAPGATENGEGEGNGGEDGGEDGGSPSVKNDVGGLQQEHNERQANGGDGGNGEENEDDDDDDAAFDFGAHARATNSPEDTTRAAVNLTNAIDSLLAKYEEGREYFKVLVEVFETELRSEKNEHMQAFHAVIPALMIDYVEHILAAKVQMTKVKTATGGFVDEGFALGVVYILELLDLHAAFDGLHWFESVRDHYTNAAATGKPPSTSERDVSVAIRMQETHVKEFQLLQFSFHGARIFFQ